MGAWGQGQRAKQLPQLCAVSSSDQSPVGTPPRWQTCRWRSLQAVPARASPLHETPCRHAPTPCLSTALSHRAQEHRGSHHTPQLGGAQASAQVTGTSAHRSQGLTRRPQPTQSASAPSPASAQSASAPSPASAQSASAPSPASATGRPTHLHREGSMGGVEGASWGCPGQSHPCSRWTAVNCMSSASGCEGQGQGLWPQSRQPGEKQVSGASRLPGRGPSTGRRTAQPGKVGPLRPRADAAEPEPCP